MLKKSAMRDRAARGPVGRSPRTAGIGARPASASATWAAGGLGAPGGGSPVLGPESSQDRDEPVPLLAEHLQQAARVEAALALGPQQQLAGQELFWYRAAVTHRSPAGPGDGRPAVQAPSPARCAVPARGRPPAFPGRRSRSCITTFPAGRL